METIYISLIDSTEKIPFVLTYGIHKELQEYLLADDRLFNMYTNTEIAETVIKMCLSKRNDMGNVVDEFTAIQTVEAGEMTLLLDYIFEYFSEFFLKNQEKVVMMGQRLNQISKQSAPS